MLPFCLATLGVQIFQEILLFLCHQSVQQVLHDLLFHVLLRFLVLLYARKRHWNHFRPDSFTNQNLGIPMNPIPLLFHPEFLLIHEIQDSLSCQVDLDLLFLLRRPPQAPCRQYNLHYLYLGAQAHHALQAHPRGKFVPSQRLSCSSCVWITLNLSKSPGSKRSPLSPFSPGKPSSPNKKHLAQ